MRPREVDYRHSRVEQPSFGLKSATDGVCWQAGGLFGGNAVLLDMNAKYADEEVKETRTDERKGQDPVSRGRTRADKGTGEDRSFEQGFDEKNMAGISIAHVPHSINVLRWSGSDRCQYLLESDRRLHDRHPVAKLSYGSPANGRLFPTKQGIQASLGAPVKHEEQNDDLSARHGDRYAASVLDGAGVFFQPTVGLPGSRQARPSCRQLQDQQTHLKHMLIAKSLRPSATTCRTLVREPSLLLLSPGSQPQRDEQDAVHRSRTIEDGGLAQERLWRSKEEISRGSDEYKVEQDEDEQDAQECDSDSDCEAPPLIEDEESSGDEWDRNLGEYEDDTDSEEDQCMKALLAEEMSRRDRSRSARRTRWPWRRAYEMMATDAICRGGSIR